LALIPWWGFACGVLLGLASGKFGMAGAVSSGFVGLVMGVWLQSLIRREIASGNRQMADELPDRAETSAREAVAPVAPPRPRRPFDPDPADLGPPRPVDFGVPAAAAMPMRRPEPEPAPARSSVVEQAVTAARGWLFGGNTIVRLGLVILFVGLSFLASYAASAGLFPIELRLALVGAVGIALLVVGFNRRELRPDFALALQGAGVATLYLTIFGAARLFDVVPILPAFALMVIVCGLGCALALLQNSQPMAVASFAGGFAVPLLLSTGQGNIAMLFGYYAVLNLGVLALAARRAWRVVNLLGFFATFGIATAWGVLTYQPENYAMAQSFLIVFVLIYVSAALLYERRMPGLVGGFVDSTLLFGPALAGFALQIGLVRDVPFGSAFSALGFGALYLLLAKIAARRGSASPLLTETLIAICIGFITLAIPLALGARWTSSAWAIEGAGAFWVGMRQARWLPRLFGLFLQGVAALVLLGSLGPNIARLPLLGGPVIGAILVALPILAIAWGLRRPIEPAPSRFGPAYAAVESQLGAPWFLGGFGLAWAALVLEATRLTPALETGKAAIPVFAPITQMLLAMLAFVAAAWVAARIGWRRQWPVAGWPARVMLLPMLVALVGQIGDSGHILSGPGWPLWLAALGLHYQYLHSADAQPDENRRVSAAIHVGSVWLVTLMLADCLWLGIDRAGLWGTSWASVVLLFSIAAVLAGLTLASSAPALRDHWPMRQHAGAYRRVAAMPLAWLAYGGAFITAIVEPGQTAPLPYVPLLNPVDLTLGITIAALLYWRRAVVAAMPAQDTASRPVTALLAWLGFVVINTIWLRIAHHFLGVNWTPWAMFDSFIVEAGLAILWTVLALALMLVANRRQARLAWLVGAVLLVLVTAKLFLVDLSNANGGARVVTFLAVGVLMLIVGYFAPLPPRDQQAAEPN
jgi:uncharacterized membrane protein